MLISFSNEIANISEKIPGVDSHKILKALISDKRITSIVNNERIVPSLESYLIPGCGFGGSCFPKDVRALTKTADKNGYDAKLLKEVDLLNERQKKSLFDKIKTIFNIVFLLIISHVHW